jgi:protein-tyrosine phosphatase
VAQPSGDFDWLLDDLAVGGPLPHPDTCAAARRCGFGAVIDVRLEARDRSAEFAAAGLPFLHLPTVDLGGVSAPMLDAGVGFARSAAASGRRLLIHCQHGIGRSALVALCVLVDRGEVPLLALRRSKDAREKISPSPPQYEAWAHWLRRRDPPVAVPSFDAFAEIAYRHLHGAC